MRRVLLCSIVFAVAGLAATAEDARARTERGSVKPADYLVLITKYRTETWRWERLMGKPRTPTSFSAARSTAIVYRRWVLGLWKRRAVTTRRKALNPPHKSAWLCIQRHEAAWNDGGGPYYGGLQMDWSFMRAYGRDLLRRKGTADNWTPTEQMWVGERALRAGRGFYPWPNAARNCRLV